MLCAFFDRDGTIAGDYPDEVWKTIKEPELMPGAIETLAYLRSVGYEIIIITNQYIIDEGYITQEEYNLYSQKLLTRLAEEGIEVMDVFFCPHARSYPCKCRKPETGLIQRALKKYPDIDMSRAFMVGDSEADMELARRMSIPAYGIGLSFEYDKFVPMNSLLDFKRAFRT